MLTLTLAAAAAGAYFAYTVSLVDTVYPGTTALGTDFSGMSREQVTQTLDTIGAERYRDFSVTAALPLENSLTVTAQEAGVRWNGDALGEAIWSYGRDAGFVGNALSYYKAVYRGENEFATELDLDISLDEDAVRAIVAETAVDIDEQLVRSGVEVLETEIRLQKGASGLTLDEAAVFNGFRDAFLAADRSGFTYESAPDPDEKYDFQTLHDELYSVLCEGRIIYAPEYIEGFAGFTETLPGGNKKEYKTVEPVYYAPQEGDEALDFNGEPYIITESSIGRDFDVAEAERLWAAAGYGDTVVVPLQVEYPQTTTEEINSVLFADPLSKNWTMVRLMNRDYCDEVRTSLSGSTKNRISNVKKACELIDGIVLMPGEIFSYNDALGQRTEENGWLPAPAYADNEVRQENGGGICQVSSTLYNAALYSNLEIVARTCHLFQVGYLPPGMDATVSWGGPEFMFRNDKNYPIKIHAWVDDTANECCVQILGTDVDHVYVIMRFNKWTRYDETGTQVDADGNAKAIGTAAATWREIYNDGDDWATAKPLSNEYEVYSQYSFHDE